MNISSVSTFIPTASAPVKASQPSATVPNNYAINAGEATTLSQQVGSFFASDSSYSLAPGKAVDLLNA